MRFTIPHRSQVQLIVYDMNGRVIKTLVNGVKDAGTHSITFQDNSLPTGIYFYKLTADGYSDVKKMTIR
ncbi:MAG: T9SS type A sorting domain-containing protein [Chitinophagaceae bacterium]|nr:T9SS type A sorting domain-containing protein [Chitinophagaceae bacterium]